MSSLGSGGLARRHSSRIRAAGLSGPGHKSGDVSSASPLIMCVLTRGIRFRKRTPFSTLARGGGPELSPAPPPVRSPTAVELRQKGSPAWLLPLPAERGEGWGEGSVFAPGVYREENSLGPPLPSPLLPWGRRGRSRRVLRGNFLNSTAGVRSPPNLPCEREAHPRSRRGY
jgi:hypothetical protein